MLIIANMEQNRSKIGREQFLAVIDDFRRTGDREAEGTSRLRLGIWLRTDENNEAEVLANFYQAAAIFRQVHNQEKELQVLKEIAITHLNKGKLDRAEAELLTVLNRYKAIHFPNLHYTYNLLSVVSRLKEDINKGILYSMLCIESMNKTRDTVSAASFYGDMARMYLEAGNRDKATEWYRKSLRAWQQEGLPNFALFYTAGFIARELINQHRANEAIKLIVGLVNAIPTNTIIQKACVSQNLAYCYEAVQNYPMAEKYYLDTLNWYTKVNMNFEASQQLQEQIGKFYVNQHQFTKAGYYLRNALRFFPQKNSLSTIRDIHFLLFKVDSAQGNYLSAMNHFRQHKILNDSIVNETKSKQIASLQIQYDTQKKEQNIALLTKQSKLQQSELQRAQTTRNGIIAGALLLAGLLGVSYNRYRLKQRSNRLLEAKQTEINHKNHSLQRILADKVQLLTDKETLLADKDKLLEEREWMLREIHHRVKNNLQIITSMLNAQSESLQDPTALMALRESQNRVHAMALIHQKLYQADNLGQVQMTDYIQDIVTHLLDSFEQPAGVVNRVDVSVLQLDVTLATPVGLIINEAVTNSLKYAFPNGRPTRQEPGIISIDLHRVDQETCLLTITALACPETLITTADRRWA